MGFFLFLLTIFFSTSDCCNSSSLVKGEDLLIFCDSYDLEAILEDTAQLEGLDLKEIQSDGNMFAFCCNLYNLMFLHGAILEAKAHKVI